MRDAGSYEDRAVNCLQAVMEDGADVPEFYAQLDAMAPEELHALMEHADVLRLRVRSEWLRRTTKPASNA